MSFGRRLRLFFAGIVVIPMIVLVVFAVEVSRDSRDGKADARLDAGLDTASAIYDEALHGAPDEAKLIATEIGPGLANPDSKALQAVADRELSKASIAAVRISGPNGEVIASSGPADAVGTGESTVRWWLPATVPPSGTWSIRPPPRSRTSSCTSASPSRH